MIKKFFFICVLILSLVNCSEIKTNKSSTSNLSNRKKQISIEMLFNDSCSYHLTNPNIYIACFNSQKINIYFTGQCMVSFESKLENNAVKLKWKHDIDCTYDCGIDSLAPANESDVFASCISKEDSVFISYSDTAWRNICLQRGFYFPKYLKIEKLENISKWW